MGWGRQRPRLWSPAMSVGIPALPIFSVDTGTPTILLPFLTFLLWAHFLGLLEVFSKLLFVKHLRQLVCGTDFTVGVIVPDTCLQGRNAHHKTMPFWRSHRSKRGLGNFVSGPECVPWFLHPNTCQEALTLPRWSGSRSKGYSLREYDQTWPQTSKWIVFIL